MSRKNHQTIDGRLLRTDKRISHLKQKQIEKINAWLYEAYRIQYQTLKQAPDKRHNRAIVNAAYDKIQAADIWIPYEEVWTYYLKKKSKFEKRMENEQNRILKETD
ncbi:transposase [Eubacterium sp. 1001713B170207_170306_E7]|uniref:transposase n=1 Tax=Eubacterium sp. 1001713B170207_170306_E7 TaxID=2787097 RepID=UPI00189C02B8|nr:transposase [Eubacterium sp. 1001713B170207_170306_E7]